MGPAQGIGDRLLALEAAVAALQTELQALAGKTTSARKAQPREDHAPDKTLPAANATPDKAP
jgi:hypothetical protein